MPFAELETWTKADLLDLAKKQQRVRLMIVVIGVSVFLPFVLPASLEPFVRAALFILTIVVIYFAYKLIVAVLPPSSTSLIVVYVVLSSIPLVNLIALAYLDREATKRLRASGVRVGLVSANPADLDALKDDVVYSYLPSS